MGEGDQRTGEFLVELRLDGCDSPVGTIRSSQEAASHPFHGWLEFMALLDQLRLEAVPAAQASESSS